MALKTRKPTGAVPWPLILIEGGEKSGKSWALAALSASQRVGDTYWIDLAEGSGDEYGAIPGTRYEIVEHDGRFDSILRAVEEINAIAAQALADGKPPVVLGIDSMTAEWDLLKDWATTRARNSDKNQALLKRKPDAEITVSTNYWNDANARHRKLMKILMTFPGIVVMTARGRWVAAIENGKPVENLKVYSVEGQKSLAYDASVWVRLSRDAKPMVIGARSVHTGIRPGIDEPQPLPDDWTLDALVFDLLKCDPRTAHVRDLVELRPDRTPEQIAEEALLAETTADRIRELYREAKTFLAAEVPNGAGKDEALGDLLIRIGKERTAAAHAQAEAAEPSNPGQREAIVGGWAKLGLGRPESLARIAEVIGRTVDDEAELTFKEALAVHDWQTRQSWSDVEESTPPAPVIPKQHATMHALWSAIGYTDRDRRMNATRHMIKRHIDSSSELTYDEAEIVIQGLRDKQKRDKASSKPTTQEQDDRELAGVGR